MARTMSAARQRRQGSEEDNEIDITPMIDITFLLLTFFMMTSTMQPSGGLNVPAAKNGLGVSVDESCVLSIFDNEGSPITYLSDGASGDEVGVMSQITEYIQQQRKKYVIIKADRRVASGYVEEVARAAAEAQGEEELQFFVAVQDKP